MPNGGSSYTGIIPVYKEAGYTSHDVVAVMRKLLKTKRIGHTGTLDPEVTGVLPVCVGSATKVVEYIQDMGKVYSGVMRLGIATDTEDIHGTVLNTSDYMPHESEILKVMESFVGRIKQIPPMYSAVKVEGVRLYKLARDGIVVPRNEREVNIFSLSLTHYNYPFVDFNCSCSKGTYMRTLVKDIGEKLGSYGTLEKLNRDKVGPFKMNETHSLAEIEDMIEQNDFNFLYPTDSALPAIPDITVEDSRFKQLINGLPTSLKHKDPGIYRVYSKGEFIGIGEVCIVNDRTVLKIKKMLYRE